MAVSFRIFALSWYNEYNNDVGKYSLTASSHKECELIAHLIDFCFVLRKHFSARLRGFSVSLIAYVGSWWQFTVHMLPCALIAKLISICVAVVA